MGNKYQLIIPLTCSDNETQTFSQFSLHFDSAVKNLAKVKFIRKPNFRNIIIIIFKHANMNYYLGNPVLHEENKFSIKVIPLNFKPD